MGKPKLKIPGMKPEKVNGVFTDRTNFYIRELWRIVKGMYEIDCPDEWNKDYLLNVLLSDGYLLVSESPMGVYPFRCTFKEYDYTRFPLVARVVIPRMDGVDLDFEVKLGERAQLIYLDWEGDQRFWNYRDLIRTFAQRLASCDAGIDVNIMNSRVAYIGEAESKAQADALKLAFDRVSEGDPLIVYRKDSLASQTLSVFFNNVKNNYIADLLQDTKRSIINEFLTLLGINNANTDKKERLITAEANSNNEELAINAEEICRNLCDTCTKASSLLGTNFSISLLYSRESREQAAEEAQQKAQQLMQQRGDNKDDSKRSNGDMGLSASRK